MRKILFLSLLLLGGTPFLNAQEFIATVKVDAQQTGQQNQQVFKSIENQLAELINNNTWTSDKVASHERIQVNFTLFITSFESNTFRGSLQVQASRPVFGSLYQSQLYSMNDRQVNFQYTEHEAMAYNVNKSDSNLVSIIAYHLYTILGMDADSFKENAGETYFSIAKQIVNTASGTNYAGWTLSDGSQTRYSLNDALLSPVYRDFHKAMYMYHRLGLDFMHKDPKKAKENVQEAIAILRRVNDKRPNSYLLRSFFDAKSKEIQTIFSGGPTLVITDLIENLNLLAPTKRQEWAEIRL